MNWYNCPLFKWIKNIHLGFTLIGLSSIWRETQPNTSCQVPSFEALISIQPSINQDTEEIWARLMWIIYWLELQCLFRFTKHIWLLLRSFQEKKSHPASITMIKCASEAAALAWGPYHKKRNPNNYNDKVSSQQRDHPTKLGVGCKKI